MKTFKLKLASEPKPRIFQYQSIECDRLSRGKVELEFNEKSKTLGHGMYKFSMVSVPFSVTIEADLRLTDVLKKIVRYNEQLVWTVECNWSNEWFDFSSNSVRIVGTGYPELSHDSDAIATIQLNFDADMATVITKKPVDLTQNLVPHNIRLRK